jgi:hypothetical protein
VSDFFNCARHAAVQIEIGSNVGCADCLEMIRRDPATMTGDEKAEEVRSLLQEVMSIPFEPLWKRIDALVGRETYNHELGLAVDRLIEEARGTRTLTSTDEIVNDLRNTGKPVIEVDLRGAS